MANNVEHPSHYTAGAIHSTCGEPIECIDVSENYTGNVAQAMQYLWRHKLKGNAIEDLQKAAWFANREADRLIAAKKKEETEKEETIKPKYVLSRGDYDYGQGEER